MTITEQKAAQRKAGIAARRALSDTERTHSNAALCARIMALDCFKKAENILLYAAFGGEAARFGGQEAKDLFQMLQVVPGVHLVAELPAGEVALARRQRQVATG